MHSGLKAARCEQPSVDEGKVKEVLKEIDKAVKCNVPEKIFNERPKVEVGKNSGV